MVDRIDRNLVRSHAAHIPCRLSVEAGAAREVDPHALRHYAATSTLKGDGDQELVRQALRHESLVVALRYARIAKSEVGRSLLAPSRIRRRFD